MRLERIVKGSDPPWDHGLLFSSLVCFVLFCFVMLSFGLMGELGVVN